MGEVDWSKFGKGKGKKVDWSKFDGKKGGPAKKPHGILGTLGHAAGVIVTSGPANVAFKALDLPRKAALNILPGGELADKAAREHLPKKGAAGFIANTALDTVEDPLTYLSFGTTKAAKVGLEAAARTASKSALEHGATTAAARLAGVEARKTLAKQGTKALSAERRAALKAELLSAEGSTEKAANKVLKNLDRGAKGGVKVAGRTLPGLGSHGPVLHKVTEAGEKVGNALRFSKPAEAVVPRAGIARTRGKEAADAFGAADSEMRAAAGNATAETVDRIYKMAKEAKITDADKSLVLDAIDVGGHAVSVPARLRPLVHDLKTITDETTRNQLAEGVLHDARDEYVPRFLTKEARQAMAPEDAFVNDAALPTQPSAVAKQQGKLKGRTNRPDAALVQANEGLVGDLGLKGPAYEMDPLVITAKRAALADRAIAQKRFFEKVAKITDDKGKPLLMRAEDAERPLGWTTVDAGPIGKYHAPVEVAKEIEHVRAVVTNDDSIREFTGLMAKLNTMWKAQATVPIIGGLGFHARNAQGNAWLNFLAGVKSPIVYSKATKIQAKLWAGKALTKWEAHVVELAKSHGVLDEGFFLTDLMDASKQGGKLGRVGKDHRWARVRAAANPVSTEGYLVRSGRALGSTVENNARLAHFIDKLGKLGDADAAAMSVKKYLFDYGDLTPFERNVLKKYIPFYTFMRKNTPLEFSELAKQPGKFAAQGHAFNELAEGKDRGELPSFLMDEPYQPYHLRGQTIAARPDLPFEAALESIDPFKQSDLGLFGGIGPSLLKYLAEEKTGKSLYTGFNAKGSTPQRLTDALLPISGKIRRGPGRWLPTGAGVGLDKDDRDQDIARLLAALTGLRTYRTDAEQ